MADTKVETTESPMDWRTLLGQRESELHFVVEGQLAVDRLLASNYEVLKTIRVGDDLSREEASNLLGYRFHRGCLAVAKKPPNATFDDFENGTIVVLPEIADPGNLGTIIRNTAALDGAGVILGKGCSPFNAKAVRASAGNLFRLPIRRAEDLALDLQTLAKTRTIVGTYLGDQSIPFDQLPQLDKPVVLILGPEDVGIDASIRTHCDHLTYLPMSRGTDSLNVACSSAIFLHELSKPT